MTHICLTIEDLYQRCLMWSDEFMPAARKEYDDLASGELESASIPYDRIKLVRLQCDLHAYSSRAVITPGVKNAQTGSRWPHWFEVPH